MIEKRCETFKSEIYMAGDIGDAKRFLRSWVLKGACVSVESVDYIYTMGQEAGFVVRVINYPRFEKSREEIKSQSELLAVQLISELSQGSCSVVHDDETVFFSIREDDL